MTCYILNSFSFNMINPGTVFKMVMVDRSSVEEVVAILADLRGKNEGGVISAVGHADTAKIFSQLLGEEIVAARVTVSLKMGDLAVVGQYVGTRLPEGATSLPEGARIDWILAYLA